MLYIVMNVCLLQLSSAVRPNDFFYIVTKEETLCSLFYFYKCTHELYTRIVILHATGRFNVNIQYPFVEGFFLTQCYFSFVYVTAFLIISMKNKCIIKIILSLCNDRASLFS